ncbi:MAG: transposon-encoded TnpW family protein [Clostridiales bacterium]|nr:transposon-encoded TnpW family protein [Clostridiales bacterium]
MDNHLANKLNGVMFIMEREVIIGNTTVIVNSYSSKDATETMEEILKRVIIKNAEIAFKKPSIRK